MPATLAALLPPHTLVGILRHINATSPILLLMVGLPVHGNHDKPVALCYEIAFQVNITELSDNQL